MDGAIPPVRRGDVLAGKYRVEAILGTGGMGVVVAATHLQLHQRVALKFVHRQGAVDASVMERFLREARAAARLRSEHIARVSDVGMLESGSPYIVMEFLDGQDLAKVLEMQGPLPIGAAAEYVAQACEALAEAHSLGIVHRDLKPQNLFVTRNVSGAPFVKVLDFGISKATTLGVQNLTLTSEVMGSPLYMAPEQMRAARNADARSDIWALGVVLYELLSQQHPFSAETITELCLKVVTEPMRPLEQVAPHLPPQIHAVIDRCLRKDPAERFQSAAALACALEPFLSEHARAALEWTRHVPWQAEGLSASARSIIAVQPNGGPASQLEAQHQSTAPTQMAMLSSSPPQAASISSGLSAQPVATRLTQSTQGAFVSARNPRPQALAVTIGLLLLFVGAGVLTMGSPLLAGEPVAVRASALTLAKRAASYVSVARQSAVGLVDQPKAPSTNRPQGEPSASTRAVTSSVVADALVAVSPSARAAAASATPRLPSAPSSKAPPKVSSPPPKGDGLDTDIPAFR